MYSDDLSSMSSLIDLTVLSSSPHNDGGAKD